MIHFITNREHRVHAEPDKVIIKETLTPEDLNLLLSLHVIGLDTEDNDLDPFIGDMLLLILGDKEHQYVIDTTNEHGMNIARELMKTLALDKERIYLGANLKFDYCYTYVKTGVKLGKMWDVMIAEQRLVQGAMKSDETGKQIPISCALDEIIRRRLGFIPNTMIYDIRMEFVGVTAKNFVFDNRHIEYGAGDITYLFDVRNVQQEAIKKYSLGFLIYGIEFPLINHLGDAELEGVVIDENKWREIIKANKEKKYEYQCKLDEEFRRLRDSLVPKDELVAISGGKWDRQRSKTVEIVQGNIFGELFDDAVEQVIVKGKTKTKPKTKEAYINYGSQDQLLFIFAKLKQPLPTKKGEYVTPMISKIPVLRGKGIYQVTKILEKIDKTPKFTTGEGAIESYLNENPNTPIRKFIQLLIEYRSANTELNTFGEKFLKKYKNPVTKRFHTIYRQASASTGRLQSGDKKARRFNSQNIPAKKSFREAFIAEEGYEMCTTDLSGAEAVIMIDKAHDEKFYQMAIVNDDAHSPLATAVWRAIGAYRVSNGIPSKKEWYAEDESKLTKTSEELANITITKKENKPIRTEFKNSTFADIYGCHDKKRAKMLNITLEEAKIAGKVVKGVIPKTFRMVEGNAKFALEHGWLILNNRTNSRMWYNPVLIAKKHNSEMEWSMKHEIEGSARNAPIQGTQADMVKEMIVEIGKTIKDQAIDAKLIFQVHDELVYKFKKGVTVMTPNEPTFESSGISIPFPEYVKETMKQVANRYLTFIKMGAEQHVGPSWTK